MNDKSCSHGSAGCHAALQGFRAMPIHTRKTAHLVIAFAWATHGLSWFLPVVKPDYPGCGRVSSGSLGNMAIRWHLRRPPGSFNSWRSNDDPVHRWFAAGRLAGIAPNAEGQCMVSYYRIRLERTLVSSLRFRPTRPWYRILSVVAFLWLAGRRPLPAFEGQHG